MLENKRIVNIARAQSAVQNWQKQGEKVVFTNGVFDLIHLGHLDYLEKASKRGNRLVVGVNSDHSAKTLAKGPARPIKDQSTRAALLAALRFVDLVILFDDPTPEAVIRTLTPNVLVKGGDYDAAITDPTDKHYIVGSDWVKQHGGRVEVIAFLPGHSTTRLEQKILDAHKS